MSSYLNFYIILALILAYPHLSSGLFSLPSLSSLPSLPFSLPSFFQEENDKVRQYKRCSPALPPISTLFEKNFEKCQVEVALSRKHKNPDENKRTDEMILAYGYDLITYNVTTDDGYILTVFRITGGPQSPSCRGKPAVLLHHGLLTASDTWLLQPNDRNLAFKLANAGYDVWLANARGTTYSQKHVVFSKLDESYWDFGLHEIGMYDIPAMIRIMLRRTGNKQIFYIGHSMGSAVISIALSEMPELNEKVKAVVMLAPAIFIGHAYNPMRSFTTIIGTPLQNWIYQALEGHFDGDKKLENIGLSPVEFCTPSAIRCGVCDNLIFFLYGYDASQANYTNLPNILSKIKNVVSLKTVIHFAQNLLSCQFRQYNYGLLGNWERYGWLQPPSYDLSAITTPVHVFYGENDNFVAPDDIDLIQQNLPETTLKEVNKVKWPSFNHVDFVVANDADILVYDRILSILDSYENK